MDPFIKALPTASAFSVPVISEEQDREDPQTFLCRIISIRYSSGNGLKWVASPKAFLLELGEKSDPEM